MPARRCATRSTWRAMPKALGYRRYWMAEHHNMPGIASAATAVALAHVAAATKTIRVGAGGIMLPNHAPLVIAEQFGTLAALHPGRIELGLGRAPGTDQVDGAGDAPEPGRRRRRLPARCGRADALLRAGAARPVAARGPGRGAGQCRSGSWAPPPMARSSRRCSACPMPSPRISRRQMMMEAIAIYRERFRPSARLEKPYVMLGINVVAADTDAEARLPVLLAAAGLPQPAARPAGQAAAAGRGFRRADRPARRG